MSKAVYNNCETLLITVFFVIIIFVRCVVVTGIIIEPSSWAHIQYEASVQFLKLFGTF